MADDVITCPDCRGTGLACPMCRGTGRITVVLGVPTLAREVCRANPGLVRSALAGDERAGLARQLLVDRAGEELVKRWDRWERCRPGERQHVLEQVNAYLDELGAVDQLALLSQCRVEPEEAGGRR